MNAAGRHNLWLAIAVVMAMCGTSAFAQPRRSSGNDRYAAARDAMVRFVIEAEGIDNQAVVNAMRTVPRHEFVIASLRHRAYTDCSLAIGSKQTISAPYIVAYMTQTIDPQPDDRVLEIGTGSGYQAAVLAEIVKEVYSVEIVPALAKSAKKRLEELGYNNVFVREGDGFQGWKEHAPFDKIIVTCSPENIPEPLIEQLKDGGLMMIPIGERYQQSFYLLKKVDGKLERERLVSTLFVPMTGESEERRRVKPDPQHPVIVNGSFELDSNDDDRVDGWHYQRHVTMNSEDPIDGSRCLRFENATPGELSQALQGSAIDGRAIGALDCAVWARLRDVVPGPGNSDQAAVVVHFYDVIRREVGDALVVTWRGTENWQEARSRILVPPDAKEMVIRVGLNGATGTLDVDDLRIAPVAR
ncbi:MAG: protein-L-isoaspartate(D-aspartate) O-methyltransferase [Planctomycetaceae bacterium]